MLDYRMEQAPLCTLMRTKAAFASKCKECDKRYLERVAHGRQGTFYLCHAGLIDLIVPVLIDGRHVGSFLGGQVLPHAPTETRFKRFWTSVSKYGFDRTTLRELYFATPWMGEQRLQNLVELISLLAAHVSELGSRILEHDYLSESPIERACAFIRAHIREPFSLEDVGKAAGIAPTYLSAVFKKELGENYAAYVRRQRVDLAKKLLTSSNYGMDRIAREAGFGSRRTFNRAFRSVTGKTPRAWRAER